MEDIGTSVLGVFDHVVERLGQRLVGLGDDEYFWEPVEGCWSLRRSRDGRWRLDGGGGGGPAPDPLPITSIAWRIGHLAGMALGGFADRRFGQGSLTPDTIDFPSRAEDVRGFLDANYQAWRSGLAGLPEGDWGDELGPAWGPYAESNTLDLALHVLDELVHHGAEIALLRDLYSQRRPVTA